MNFQKKIQKAIRLGQSGRYQELETLCRQLLQRKPRNFDALQFLGTALSKQGKQDKAIPILKQAASINRNHAGVRNNLGHAYLEKKQFNKALTVLRSAVKIAPANIEALNNLGNAYFHLRQYNEAKKAYTKALKQHSEFTLAANNLGICLKKQGRLKEAVTQHLRANDLDPSNSTTYTHLFETLMLLHATEDAEHVLEAGLSLPSLTPHDKALFLTARGLLAWLTGKITTAETSIEQSSFLNLNTSVDDPIRHVFEFHHYLALLLNERKKFPKLYEGKADQAIFFVADSHCLSPSETIVSYQGTKFRILSSIIMGCKAWHLGNSQENEYKSSLKALFRALPESSIVVLGFGEIDCRVNEGILPAHRYKGINYQQAIPELINGYVTFALDQALPYHHTLLLYGVPAPSPTLISSLPPADFELLSSIIEKFNTALHNTSKKHSLGLLDIYAASQNDEEIGNNKFYLDSHHLHPRIIPQLFESYIYS